MKTVLISPLVGVGLERMGSEADAERLSGVVAFGLALGGSDITLLVISGEAGIVRFLGCTCRGRQKGAAACL